VSLSFACRMRVPQPVQYHTHERSASSFSTGGPVYTSTDGGLTWTPDTSAGNQNWSGTTLSGSGQTGVAVTNPGLLYQVVVRAASTSAPSRAPTIAPTTASTTLIPVTSLGVQAWVGVAGSSNGTFLVAAVSGGPLYTSSDGGANWTPVTATPGSQNFTAVASSADGSKMVAVTADGQVFTSPDYGKTWVPQPGAPTLPWTSVASSASGQQLTAVAANGAIYTSPDGGQTWVPAPLPSGVANATLAGVAVSGNGSVQITAQQVRERREAVYS